MKWLEIGIVNVDYAKKEMLVDLHDGYNKALSKLEMFSHCMLFFLMEDKLELKVSKILKIEENLGQLRLKITEGLYEEGQLVDIKPYFPAEEVILDAREPINRYFINYSSNIIGEYKLLENKTFIQLNKDVLNELKNNIDLYEIPKKGEIILEFYGGLIDLIKLLFEKIEHVIHHIIMLRELVSLQVDRQ